MSQVLVSLDLNGMTIHFQKRIQNEQDFVMNPRSTQPRTPLFFNYYLGEGLKPIPNTDVSASLPAHNVDRCDANVSLSDRLRLW